VNVGTRKMSRSLSALPDGAGPPGAVAFVGLLDSVWIDIEHTLS
jgi:hypothetical protein